MSNLKDVVKANLTVMGATSSMNQNKAGLNLAFSDYTLYPEKFERSSMKGKKKTKQDVTFEIEKSTKNSNIIKVTGKLYIFHCSLFTSLHYSYTRRRYQSDS